MATVETNLGRVTFVAEGADQATAAIKSIIDALKAT